MNDTENMENMSYAFIIDKFKKRLINNGASYTDLIYFESVILKNINLYDKHEIHAIKRCNAKFIHFCQHIIKDCTNFSKISFDKIKRKNVKRYFYENHYRMYHYIKYMNINDFRSLLRCTEIYNQFINFLYKEKII